MSRARTSREQRKQSKRAAKKREHRDKYADARGRDWPDAPAHHSESKERDDEQR